MLRPLLNRSLFKLKPIRLYQRSFSAACCIIGDEILNGKTRDSNANYLGMKKTETHLLFLYSLCS